MAKVGIVMGSDSDMPIMAKAADILEELGISYEMTIISAHREPDVFFEYAKGAEKKGFKVIIAGAGMAAHLPGMCAAIFPMPVIGIPMHTTSLGGRDSLYSIVQMPSGIPVATVAINGGANAGLLAAKILATSDAELLDRLKKYSERVRWKQRTQSFRKSVIRHIWKISKNVQKMRRHGGILWQWIIRMPAWTLRRAISQWSL
jgi:5-(carboxyamino)imidazole ribonucleotide mutase